MSKSMLSKSDNDRDAKPAMRYLRQPRGPGTSWVFKMPTPPDLVGVPNPWEGKPFKKEIARGLGIRHLPIARKRRDIFLGDVRRLQEKLNDGAAFSLTSAVEWREAIAAAHESAEDPYNVGVEMVLTDKLDDAEARGIPRDQLKQFARVATGKGFPLDHAHAQYVEARRPGKRFIPLVEDARELLTARILQAHRATGWNTIGAFSAST